MAGHGGGAWKVALADFMTALMAFFLVMWILAQRPELLEGTAKYFRDPPRIKAPWTTGVLKFEAKEAAVRDINTPKSVETSASNSAAAEQKRLNAIAMGFYGMINVKSDDPNRPVDVIVSSEGVLITLYDRPQRPLFRDQTSADLTPWGVFVFQNLAWLADRHSFRVSIEGHTRKGLKMLSEVYSSWELSSDRANNVRRLMASVAVAANQFERVVAYGESRPSRINSPGGENDHRVEVKLAMNQLMMEKPATKANAEKKAP